MISSPLMMVMLSELEEEEEEEGERRGEMDFLFVFTLEEVSCFCLMWSSQKEMQVEKLGEAKLAFSSSRHQRGPNL